jgi:hypothetical protein
MVEFSSSPESRALARLKELHRREQVPPGFRLRVAKRLERLEAPAPKRTLNGAGTPRTPSPWRGGIGLLLLAAAAAVGLQVRSDRTRVTPLPEQPAAPRAAELVSASSHSGDLKAGTVEASGGMAPEVIRAVMRDELGRFRECYDNLPRPRPMVVAKLNFTIGRSGNVTAGHVDSEASPELGRCLERVLFTIRFPAPKAGDVTVGYPLQFWP